jgi:excisionase family DNA binding protein
MQQLLTTKDVANLLNVSMRTIRAWDAEGTLQAFRLPSGHRRYYLADVQEKLDSLTRKWRERENTGPGTGGAASSDSSPNRE